ncbi:MULTISPECIES: dihydrodipicolinate synthase family protein [unclassified Devosia]|uniref:dihydrodipicolinate synthase family protein n=1 Tax=unclassified Devosia TaxID=196773 RepID=UPI0009634E86|nr:MULTISPECIES: dihydrodipicolinate synthase family protein [unclassified Devosia]MBN9362692.1 dihydrodipicolinate synthase family protein [Devosia sp.]OJX23874.1 MAG: dihydrodipicolinate synthase family protein [Devosia sp. 66-14]
MPAFDIKSITGVLPAMVTPFDEDEKLDEKRLRAVVNFLIERKVEGLYITGSTGESFLMSPEERKRVVEVTMQENRGRVPVIAHIGAISTFHSIDLAQHAERTGVDAISSVPPIYWGFSADQIHGYYADITRSTKLPMIAYNVPMAALGFDMIKRLSSIDGVAGVKYTATTHHDIIRIKEEIGQDFIVYSGADEMAMSGLSFGADGIIGSFYNSMPEIWMALRDAVAAGDLKEAKRLQEIGNAVIFFSLGRGGIPSIKRAMAWMGCDAGYVRKPLGGFIDQAADDKLKAEFRGLRDERKLKGVAFLDAL